MSDANDSVCTDTLQDSRHTMARSKPGFTPGPPPDPASVATKAAADAAQAASEAKAKHNEAVKWYVDILGSPEPAANALYVEQTLTDVDILSTLTKKSIDAIYIAITKQGGASKGDPVPILAVERLRLARCSASSLL